MKDPIKICAIGCMLLAATFLQTCQAMQSAASHPGPEIKWDNWGVPHIVANSDRDSFYAFGWAQMRSHGDLLLKLYAVARGRGAEFFGESYLAADRSVRTLGIPILAEQWYAIQDKEFKENLDSFAAGVNDFARKYPEFLSDAVKAVLPVRPQDVIAHTTRVMTVFVAGISECGAVLPGFDFNDQPAASNGWALRPPYSSNGNAMLLVNPHLDWRGLETFYEAHFLLPRSNLYGVALVGSPVLQIAFNDHLGWTHTVNPMDGCDLYRLRLAGAALDNGYFLDNEVHPFTVTSDTLLIRQPDGSMVHETLLIRRARQGPVVESNGQVLAVRLALLETPLLAGMNRQWWQMGRARDLQQFQDTLRGGHLPLFNVIYADTYKNIMQVFNGIIPVREIGDAAFWQAPVPGDDKRLIWAETYAYSDLPKSINPPIGWVQNSNGAPWYMTKPFLDKNEYPYNIAIDVINNRELQGLQMLTARQTMSYDELLTAKHSTHALVADQVLDNLITAARASDDQLLVSSAEVLEHWDRQYLAKSKGAFLFYKWFEKWIDKTIDKAAQTDPNFKITHDQFLGSLFYAQPFNPDGPSLTPRDLADLPLALSALREAADELRHAAGALDVAWGDVARLRRNGADFPANGATTELGVFREIGYESANDGKLASSSGDTYIALIDFSNPVSAQVLMTYGNATQKNAFKVDDQLILAANQKLRPAWLKLIEIEANSIMQEKLLPWNFFDSKENSY